MQDHENLKSKRGISYMPGRALQALARWMISAFNGQGAAGIWTLAVQDLAVGDVGTLDAWSLSIARNCSPIRR